MARKESRVVSKYEPTLEQLKLIEARRAFARQFFKSDIEFDFYDSSSVRAGTLRTLHATKLKANFYRANKRDISGALQLLAFIKSNRALFKIDDETLLTLKDISEERQNGAIFLQTYKGLPVYDAKISAEVYGGIYYIYSTLVPSSKLSLLNVTPQTTPEKIVEINWKDWLSAGSKFTIGKALQIKDRKYSYSIPVTRTSLLNGKSVVEKDEASVSLVVVTELPTTRLAWCFSDWVGVYDAHSGDLILGTKGRSPPIDFAIRPSVCPYRVP